MFKQFRVILGVVLIFTFNSANAVVAIGNVSVDEAFDAATGIGSYNVINNSMETIHFLAVGHSNAQDALAERSNWVGGTVSEQRWNDGLFLGLGLETVSEIPLINTADFNFDEFFPDSSVVNVYFNSDVYLEGAVGEQGIASGETTGFQFFYDANFPASEFVAFGSSGTAFSGSANVVSNVPVPAAVWLFASGLIGLVGYRKTVA